MIQMNAVVKLDVTLRRFAENNDSVRVKGDTVGECLDDLIRRFPLIEEWLFDKNRILKSFILLDDRPVHSEGLGKSIREGSELRILLILAGG